VLTVTQMLRKKGVVNKFVEFYGEGLDNMSLADRATIANMAPEYGATCGFFPIDEETINYLRFTGRDEARVKLVEAYAKEQGMWRDAKGHEPVFTDTLELDLGFVEPSHRRTETSAGPRFAQRRRNRIRALVQGKEIGKVEGNGLRNGRWRRRDCRDYVLHQHIEPVGHGGGRSWSRESA
jgi:hypothetical protein